ncbi:GAF domain-containing protein [Gelidibacter salicanalis]|uniref:GAF domain-containing protein n=1 Tax=Gelidibacter salicanalis TaxID=291193 RepID=A0A934KX29_9FLAO|nr:GAF domain-containing protein [Gelidibacter salicanalis]MBJ7882162.1 GAF domain-containing protein [Gelidibacter salicanalis]
MTDINEHIDSPFLIKISFEKLLNYYEQLALSKDPFLVAKAQRVLQAGNAASELREGFTNTDLLYTYQKEINIILEDSFNELLTKNEIKTASVVLHSLIFNASKRFTAIIENAGDDFELKISNQPQDDMYREACAIILKFHYGYDINFRRSFFYEIPDANGILRTYKILYNADFVEIIKTQKAPDITDADHRLLLESYDNMALWREKFPAQSYIFKGFTINNIFDVTNDRSISEIKSSLLASANSQNKNFTEDFKHLFESLLNLKDVKVGFVAYNKSEEQFERITGEGIDSYLLFNQDAGSCKTLLCEASYKALITENTYFSIPDVEKYYQLTNGKAQYKTLHDHGIKSAILAPIASNGELLGVLEIVSTKVLELNSINANILIDVMPFIVASVLRSKESEENLIEAVIQQECTSIHPSVRWKFEREARIFLDKKRRDAISVSFGEIAFADVYPLFGQIDVKGSSAARNQATRKDLALQISLVRKLLSTVSETEGLPIYEQLNYQMDELSKEMEDHFKVDTEQEIVKFFEKEIHPLFEFMKTKNGAIADAVEDYFSKINEKLGLIYYYRKYYDDTIALINKKMSFVIDQKQIEAQLMYPHFFERYKTDGVEHNMYIGESITKEQSFNEVYLYNLRLWQLQVMAEMENEFYKNQHEFPATVEVASMILVSHQPLSIHFRMDEKQFDVDGSYNARYEVVKKRVDKALIKGTDERVTTKGKLTIIYSQKEDEEAYLNYIKFLQYKKVFDTEIELLELENLQGVTGLKAIRVPILYHKDSIDQRYYTYDDLMSDIKQS